MTNNSNSEKLLEILKNKFSNQLLEAKLTLGDVEIRINYKDILGVFNILKLDADLQFNMLLSVTATDYMDHEFMERKDPERFEMVYHLLSLKNNWRLRVKASVPENNPEVYSLTGLWKGADFMESEVWDMYGIKFTDHPDLRRILMYDEFKGFPLRKDYPVQGKQPRIPLRKPEVENTARLMNRPSLIQINTKLKKLASGALGGN